MRPDMSADASSPFNLWLLPFNDWGKTNDARIVVDQISTKLPPCIEFCNSNIELRTHVKLTEVNTRSVDQRVGMLLRKATQESVDMVLSIGVASKNGAIRFEYKTASLAGGSQQYSKGRPIDTLTPTQLIQGTAGWYSNPQVTAVVSKLNFLPSDDLEKCRPDVHGISTNPGDYLCAYMCYALAKESQLTNRSFFVHVGDFRGKMDKETQAVRTQQVDRLVAFVSEIAPYILLQRQSEKTG